jgi:hypothetical protein
MRSLDLEDRAWYIALPAAGYLCLAASGVTLACGLEAGCAALALSMAVLLAAGVHNAWDITIWIIGRRPG